MEIDTAATQNNRPFFLGTFSIFDMGLPFEFLTDVTRECFAFHCFAPSYRAQPAQTASAPQRLRRRSRRGRKRIGSRDARSIPGKLVIGEVKSAQNAAELVDVGTHRVCIRSDGDATGATIGHISSIGRTARVSIGRDGIGQTRGLFCSERRLPVVPDRPVPTL